MRRTWLRTISMLVVLLLIGAACGSGRDDEAADDQSATTEAPQDEADATFGDLPSPCGEGEGGPAGEQGITEDSIAIGYGDDAGFPGAPGLAHELTDAMEAMIDWCNEQGGINGREIVGTYYDAKVTEVVNVMTKACDEVFMLVGEGWALDVLQEETRVGCGLPAVPGYAVGAVFSHGPLKVEPMPYPVDAVQTYGATVLADQFPEKVKKTAILSANHVSSAESRAKYLEAWPKLGFEFLDCGSLEYNVVGESDWRPFALRLKECGAEVVAFIGQPFPTFQNFVEAANQLDFDPIYHMETTFYDEKFRKYSANGLADKVYLRTPYALWEERDDVKAVDDYLTLIEEADGDVAILGMQATSAFLLWATGVKACGAELTRQCVLDEIAKIDDWTAGGLHAPTNPAGHLPPDCSAVLKVEKGEYVRVRPTAKGKMECDPKYVSKIHSEFVDQAKLNKDRVSTVHMK